MKKTILSIATTIISATMLVGVVAAPLEPLNGRGDIIIQECTVIGVAYQNGDLILNLTDSNGNLYQYTETENFYFDSPINCIVTLERNTVINVDFE